MVKRILGIILILTITIGVGGCMFKGLFKRRYSGEQKERIVHRYLKEKYDEEFDLVSVGGMDWTLDVLKYFMRPKNGTDEDLFAVWFSLRDDGTYHLSDGYFAVIIKDEYEAVIGGFVEEIYDDFKLQVRIGSEYTYPERLNKDTKISEIYKEGERGGLNSEITILVKESAEKKIGANEGLIKIAKKMQKNRLAGYIEFIVIHEEEFEKVELAGMKTGEVAVDSIVRTIRVDRNLEVSEVKEWQY